jgi:Rps23 Pro-64 3,4-dihydroxylase Tpa1-like proline 4-hydroxylase
MDGQKILPRKVEAFAHEQYSAAEIGELQEQFQTSLPFPHLVLSDFVSAPADDVLAAFPDPEWRHWHRFEDSYQFSKRYCQDLEYIPELPAAMIQELTSPAFLAFLERVTGIEKLIPDPYLEGAGLHMSGQGGILAPHTDFHWYAKLGLYRRLNVLVYLNPDWREEDGGCLELYEKGDPTPRRTIVPDYGACVVFQTDDRSVHGFSKPISRPNLWRRSIALYYYTCAEAPEFSGDETTHWQQHASGGGAGRLRLALYKTFLKGSRMFSRIAYQVNPNMRRRLTPRIGLALGMSAGFAACLFASIAWLLADVAGFGFMRATLPRIACLFAAGASAGGLAGYLAAMLRRHDDEPIG